LKRLPSGCSRPSSGSAAPAGDQAQARRVLLLAVVSSICMPTHTPISGLPRGGVQHGVLQPGVAQLAHAVAHRALAGQHHALGGQHLLGGCR
jgi:hypothetical protein